VAIDSKQLNLHSEPATKTVAELDLNQPLSYQNWFKSRIGIIPGQEYIQYNTYLIEWYTKKAAQTVNYNAQLRLNYLTLLRQLQLFYTNEEVETWYSLVNLENEKELLISIPYYAKKLKEVALYYLQLRENIKKNKIQYNLKGTSVGITQQLQEQLLTLFTKKPNTSVTVPSNIWTKIPDLSSVKDNITLSLEEYYDDQQYFDRNSQIPVSEYFNLTGTNLTNYFSNKNISISAADWIYKQGVFDITDQQLANNINLAQQLYEKYIGENKFFSTADRLLTSTQVEFYDIFLGEGNNTLYWPQGAYKPDITTLKFYDPVPLTAAKIDGTAGSTILDSDTIFVKTSKGIEGAWLRFKEFENYNTQLNAYIEGNKTTSFKFPYPGYGLSAEDLEWTGPSLNYTPEFSYFNLNVKNEIKKAYWNSSFELSGVNPIPINETTLVQSGAYANENYLLADKVRIKPTPPRFDDTNYSGEVGEAWLYKMTKTDIPINIGNSVVLWPYQRLNPESEFPKEIPANIYNACEPVSLSSISTPGATSSNTLSTADKIFKIANYQDVAEEALECAWLSGLEVNYGNLRIISQPSLNGVFQTGAFTKFLWEGPDRTDANTVFKTFKHQPDCTFATSATSYHDYQLCTCQQILFTPFGHPGTDYDNYSRSADFIAEDAAPSQQFNLGNWSDSKGTAYTSSSAFGWYKTSSKIGWGDGTWYSNTSLTNNKFYLRKGKSYIYYRTKAPDIYSTLTTIGLPELVIRHPYTNPKVQWIKAVKTPENEWVSTGQPSNMVLNAGDLFLYQKPDTTFHQYTTAIYQTVSYIPTATNINKNIWVDYDYLTVGEDIYGNEQSVFVSYPRDYYTIAGLTQTDLSGKYAQYPLVNYINVVDASWTLTDPLSTTYRVDRTTQFSFVPGTTGTYYIEVTAITAQRIVPFGSYTPSQSGFYVFKTIPPITAIPNQDTTTFVNIVSTFFRPTPGYIINVPLYGWNYNTNKPSKTTIGARPFWANSSTIYRDVISWGTPYRLVDNYNVLTQPTFSDLVLNSGNYFEYERTYPSSFTWSEPVNYKIGTNEKIWSTIVLNTTAASNFKDVLGNITNQLVALPIETPSPIIFEKFVDNQPVEIWYKALESFIWTVTATPLVNNTTYIAPEILEGINALYPWGNLSNKFYPNFNVFQSLDSLYTEKDKGGYFTPNNLGASVYIDKDFTGTLSTSSNAITGVFESSSQRIGGRGLTKTDQPTPYTDLTENNLWLKEPINSGPATGTIKKEVSKKYQKFIPYQSGYETNNKLQVGIILPTSRQTPWGGINDTEWTDSANKPESFTGVINTSAWAETQVLKFNQGLVLDNWVTDIFGNQYGLYKNTKDLNTYDSKNIPGEIWVRKNSQFVSSAKTALSGVFDTYQNLSFHNQLISRGINKIDMFFDTLYIETSGLILLEDLDYNFDTDTIFSISDNARYLSLAVPVTATLKREINNTSEQFIYAKAGETWFFPQEKNIIISVCSLSGDNLQPMLYRFNIVTKDFIKIFPNNLDQIIVNSLSSLKLQTIDSPVLAYNSLNKEFVMSVLGKDDTNKDNLVEFTIANLPDSYLKNINVYTPSKTIYTNNPPAIPNNLNINAALNQTFNYQITASNYPTSFTLLTSIDWLTLTNTGNIFITATSIGEHSIPFYVSNNIGPTYYSLYVNISAPSVPPTIVHTISTTMLTSQTVTYQVTALNYPSGYVLLTSTETNWIELDQTGLFTIDALPTPGIHKIPFSVSNLAGTNNYTLTATIIN
jgi:hypothetical protein